MNMTAREFLLYLRSKQQDIVGYNPITKTLPDRPNVWLKVVSSEADSFIFTQHSLRSEEFGSDWDVLLNRLKEMIESQCPECARSEFAIGELFLSYPQAFIMRVPQTQDAHIIALHTTLCMFLRYVTEMAMIRLRLDNGWPAKIRRKDLYPWFNQYLRFFLLREGSAPPIPSPLDEADMATTELTYVAALLWIVCHEYGHFLAHHLKGEDLPSIQVGGVTVQSCEALTPGVDSWQREFEADLSGCDLLSRVVQHQAFAFFSNDTIPDSERSQYASWGIDVVIGLLGLVDRRYWLYGKAQYSAGSHPPAHVRFQQLRTHRPSMFPGRPMLASIITGYFDALYKELPGTLELREP